ncbi:vitamin B12 dependent-methionine synthase activation domain-containing protein [Chloroflexota bacterium]
MNLLEDFKIVISEREVLRYQGYKKPLPLRDDVAEILIKSIEAGYKLIRPKAVYTQLSVIGIDDGVIRLDNDSILNLGSSIEYFRKSSHIGIAICTSGPALEERVSELLSCGEFAEALMLDSVGSVAVECVADLVNNSICQTANRLNMKVGARFSPGYGRWNLRDQEALFHLCDAERIGVSLNSQFMMIPRKSVSFCVGIGRELVTGSRVNTCRRCNMKECQYRKGGKNAR